ncbi:fimbrial biogenesis chaperone [Neisseria weaveri]|uniref:fimbrial biogenesis chaperone n=1 Tax=Neisseria weaveri TaxID=28091 RepID=UPI0007C9B22B|nr:molecular chaperone [Neisseria weaveri]SAY50857.1 Chaperone protein focC precursor [Neisseria weaveri]
MHMGKFLSALLIGSLALPVHAGVVIHTTRVIFDGSKPVAAVQLENSGEVPSLMKSWLEYAAEQPQDKQDKAHENKKLPFIISPPVARIEAKTRQTLRIRYTGEPLAEDRESLFYLNVLDVPPKPKKEQLTGSGNYMQFAITSRLKFFFRPKGLPYGVDEAYEKVTWHIGSNNTVVVKNPTPYFITYSAVSLMSKDKVEQTAKQTDMVAPFSESVFELSKPGNSKADSVEWQLINDFGGIGKGRSVLQY